MKTERLVLLTTPKFKAFVTAQAKREGVSAAELIRRRVEAPRHEVGGPDEALLIALTAQLRASIKETRAAVRESLDEVDKVLRDLRAHADTSAKTTAA